jgi:hypothetical protein
MSRAISAPAEPDEACAAGCGYFAPKRFDLEQLLVVVETRLWRNDLRREIEANFAKLEGYDEASLPAMDNHGRFPPGRTGRGTSCLSQARRRDGGTGRVARTIHAAGGWPCCSFLSFCRCGCSALQRSACSAAGCTSATSG